MCGGYGGILKKNVYLDCYIISFQGKWQEQFADFFGTRGDLDDSRPFLSEMKTVVDNRVNGQSVTKYGYCFVDPNYRDKMALFPFPAEFLGKYGNSNGGLEESQEDELVLWVCTNVLQCVVDAKQYNVAMRFPAKNRLLHFATPSDICFAIAILENYYVRWQTMAIEDYCKQRNPAACPSLSPPGNEEEETPRQKKKRMMKLALHNNSNGMSGGPGLFRYMQLCTWFMKCYRGDKNKEERLRKLEAEFYTFAERERIKIEAAEKRDPGYEEENGLQLQDTVEDEYAAFLNMNMSGGLFDDAGTTSSSTLPI